MPALSLQDLADLSQIIGVLAVFGSLVFVGVEIRQNSAITRGQVHQQVSDTFSAYLETLSSHAKIVGLGSSGSDGLRKLSDDDLLKFSFLMAGLFKIWENAFYQRRSGFLDERAWQSNEKWLKTWYGLPGVHIWWTVRRDLFAAEFQTFVEALPPSGDSRSISSRLRDAAQPLSRSN